MGRKKLLENQLELPLKEDGGNYFDSRQSKQEFFSSGCAILDCILGQGWPEGKMVNIIGDSGSGKSLLCIEAAANYITKHPDSPVYYVETEAGFSEEYAQGLGIPVDQITLIDSIYTVEDLFKFLEEKISTPSLFIVDSLDALSDSSEMDRAIDESTYGGNKAKKLSELFRRLHAKLSRSNSTVIVVSQTRDNIGVSFGEKHTRSGGKALKFYSSIELWIAYTGQIKKTINGVQRTIGAAIKAKTKKNRMAPPFRDCEMELIFGFGLDDLKANLEWIETVKRYDVITDRYGDRDSKATLKRANSLEQGEFQVLRDEISLITKDLWKVIETDFSPGRRKY